MLSDPNHRAFEAPRIIKGQQQRDRNACERTVILLCGELALQLPGAVGLIAPTAGSAIGLNTCLGQVLGDDGVTGGGASTPLDNAMA
ncbi:hypothetical protein [Kribbella sp. NPDC055071]